MITPINREFQKLPHQDYYLILGERAFMRFDTLVSVL